MSVTKLLSVWTVPLFVVLILSTGMARRIPVFDEFVTGAGEGLKTCIKVLPALVALMTAVSMLRASGILELIASAAQPAAHYLGLPPEIVPLALLRPISGSGSLAMLENIYAEYGADSMIGRVSSVLQSSTETTFYTMAVYYGATGVRRTRHTLLSASGGDLTGILLSALTVRLLLS